MKAFFIKVANFFRTFISTICKLLGCRNGNTINIDLDNDGQVDIAVTCNTFNNNSGGKEDE